MPNGILFQSSFGTLNGSDFEFTVVTKTPLYTADGHFLHLEPRVLMKVWDGKLTVVKVYDPEDFTDVHLDEESLKQVRIQAKLRANFMLDELREHVKG